ncbi:hypothetical protein [Bacillus pumilus]
MKITVIKGPLFPQAEARAYKYLSGILIKRMKEHQEKIEREKKELVASSS